jgi:hypothetical protein
MHFKKAFTEGSGALKSVVEFVVLEVRDSYLKQLMIHFGLIKTYATILLVLICTVGI